MTTEREYTRQQWEALRLMSRGVPWPMALEAVASTALADETTDWDETRTFADWAKDYPMEES